MPQQLLPSELALPPPDPERHFSNRVLAPEPMKGGIHFERLLISEDLNVVYCCYDRAG